MISSYLGFTAYTRTRSLALSAAARNRPPYCIRGVAPTIAMERGLSILWIDAICGSVQNSMTPPEKNVVRRVGKPTLYERGCHHPIFPHHWLKQSACGEPAGRCRTRRFAQSTESSSVTHVYSWLRAGLLPNLENRLLGRTISVY